MTGPVRGSARGAIHTFGEVRDGSTTHMVCRSEAFFFRYLQLRSSTTNATTRKAHVMSDKQVWFITGAGRGLGADIARAALAAGHAVVATGRDVTKITATLGQHHELLAVKLDVTLGPAADDLVDRRYLRWAVLHCLRGRKVRDRRLDGVAHSRGCTLRHPDDAGRALASSEPSAHRGLDDIRRGLRGEGKDSARSSRRPPRPVVFPRVRCVLTSSSSHPA